MRARRGLLLPLGLAAVLACGELKEGTDTVAGADASTDAAPAEDAGAGDAVSDVPSPPEAGPADAGSGRLVFVTSAQVTGAFAVGKPDPWAAADAICATEAVANSLAGEFVAWLSYMSNGTAFNALGRIADAPYYLPGNLVRRRRAGARRELARGPPRERPARPARSARDGPASAAGRELGGDLGVDGHEARRDRLLGVRRLDERRHERGGDDRQRAAHPAVHGERLDDARQPSVRRAATPLLLPEVGRPHRTSGQPSSAMHVRRHHARAARGTPGIGGTSPSPGRSTRR